MSWPTISTCYKEILVNPSLLCLFPEEEWTSIRELPLMGAFRFSVVLERLFACLISPAMWGKAGVEFITNNGWKISREAIPMVILVIDGVGEGSLGMVTTFCHHNQAKVEAFIVLSILHQCNSLKPNVDVVRRFTNSPYLPWRSFGFLYLDVTTHLGVLHPPNSHWTGYAYAGYSLTPTPRWFCHRRSEKKG